MDYKKFIGVINDFPKKGISFKDISPLLKDKEAFASCIDDLAKMAEKYHPTVILAPDARGFIFGAALALKMGLGFVMARKPGKLPGNNIKYSYSLEYGENSLEVRENSFAKEDRVLLVDDLLATGGSLKAVEEIARKAGGTPVAALAVIYLRELHGEKQMGVPTEWLIDLSAEQGVDD